MQHEQEELVQVLYRIPKRQRRALNIIAARRDISTTELVRRVFRDFIAEHERDKTTAA